MAFLQVTFDRLLASKAVSDYFRREKLDVKLLKNMKIRMLAINQLIDHAEDNETTNLGVKEWLGELKDVVFDGEDVLDVIATLAHENEVSTTPWNPFDRPLQKELEDVLCTMKCLLEQKDVFDWKPSTRSNSTSKTLRPPTTSLVVKSCVYGRDDDKEEIKKLLLSNDGSKVSVIAIVGMGGLGKTTLAQLLYNHYQINSVFKRYKVWICVAEDFDVIKITKTILERLTSQSYATNDLELLQTKLKETLLGRKFLIVLDDVWDENDTNWENVRKPFASAAKGSKIIVTTRSEKVAFVMGTNSTHKLKPLSGEACWKLFSEHAFVNVQSNGYSTFEANVVKKCGGLPLATKVLGGLLRGLGRDKWGEILSSNMWNSSDEVLPVLRLSYHYLPSNLKWCFAFCSIVPKDFDFEREKLVLLWMAASLLQDSNNKRMIDVGYEYLRDLESRSLIQPSINGHRLYFSMHDVVNDLAKSVSREFYKSFDLGSSFNIGEKTRHCSYVLTKNGYEDHARFKRVIKAKRLRTFLPLSRESYLQPPPPLRSEIWLQLNVLRSLSLPYADIQKLPNSIGNLKLLRYLDLSKNYSLNHLPESLGSLYNLEVLNLYSCTSLTKLPSKMRQLTKLNHLDIRHTKSLQEMPLQMGRLKNLDALTDFVVGKCSGSSIRELKELEYLQGKLAIRGMQNITHPEDALVANLKGKSYLEELWLEWDIDSDNSEDARIILENLRPPLNLKKLSIIKYSGTRLSDWSGDSSFDNLVDIELSGYKHCFDLSPLGRLPSLKSLHISDCDSLVTLIPVELPNDIDHAGDFSALEKLNINGCPNFEYFDVGKWCAPKMADLELRNCQSLKVLPENMCYIFPSLESLSLNLCDNLEALPPSGLPSSLRNLKIIGCMKLIENRSTWGLERLKSLSTLTISGYVCEYLQCFFPEEGLLPSSLSELFIENVPNLRSLNGKSFQLLTSLKKLRLSYCRELQCIPELPSTLSFLEIWNCPLLESRCQKEQGEDWSKIARIANIDMWFPRI